jgi:hypothetical protein
MQVITTSGIAGPLGTDEGSEASRASLVRALRRSSRAPGPQRVIALRVLALHDVPDEHGGVILQADDARALAR